MLHKQIFCSAKTKTNFANKNCLLSFPNNKTIVMNQLAKQPTNYAALSNLIIVFFFWGFVAAGNGIFIPFCKTHFNLNQFQSQLIDTSYYGAYFYGSLVLYFFSQASGVDLLNRIGYKDRKSTRLNPVTVKSRMPSSA